MTVEEAIQGVVEILREASAGHSKPVVLLSDAERILRAALPPVIAEAQMEAFVACAKWIDSGEGVDLNAMLNGGADAEATRRYGPKGG